MLGYYNINKILKDGKDKFTMNKRFTSTGRSMIEMIGVLAIIAVLSVVGLSGIRLAMNHIKANNLLEDVRLFAATIIHNNYDVDTQEFIPNTYYGFEAVVSNDAVPLLSIDAFEVEEEVCGLAYDKAHETYVIEINGDLKGKCESGANNTMTFIFDAQTLSEDVCASVKKKKDCRITEVEKDKYGCVIKEPITCDITHGRYCGADGECKNCSEAIVVPSCTENKAAEKDGKGCVSIEYEYEPCTEGQYCDESGKCEYCPDIEEVTTCVSDKYDIYLNFRRNTHCLCKLH